MPPTKWEPSPNDTTSFAAFRWFANAIENDALVLYATDRTTFAEIEEVLRTTLKELAKLRKPVLIPHPDGDCPDGWVLCDGVCMPSCDMISGVAAQQPRR